MKSDLVFPILLALSAALLALLVMLSHWLTAREIRMRNSEALPPRPTATPPPPRTRPPLNKSDLEAAALKYLELGEEIAACPDAHLRTNMMHTHSKLGAFIGDAIGYKNWREAINGREDE